MSLDRTVLDSWLPLALASEAVIILDLNTCSLAFLSSTAADDKGADEDLEGRFRE